MAKEIGAESHTIDKVFTGTTYHIDFYQRDYKWEKEPVEELFNDIYDKFRLKYEDGANASLDPDEETIDKYPWYYLNTYTTNKVDGKVFIVDGQQRLTTLALMLIALQKISKKEYGSTLAEWIGRKICGWAGNNEKFWMNHEKHINALKGLFEGKEEIDTSSGDTAKNMAKNYKIIETKFEEALTTKHKFETFVWYFLHRVILANLEVEQADTPMIFEAINDRGKKLNPYEILKGKLLGQITDKKAVINKYNPLWEKQVNDINKESEEQDHDEIDHFFHFYLRGKFANNRKEGEQFGDNYHREIFLNKETQVLKLKRTPGSNGENVQKFLDNDFKYYTDVYRKILDASPDVHPFINYNRWIDLYSYYKLLLSGLALRDEKEEEKIKTVAYEWDRLRSLLLLQDAFDDNAFTEAEYKISEKIREQPLETYQGIFDEYLLELLTKSKGTKISSPFQYEFFKDVGLNTFGKGFIRYFLARIEEFLSNEMLFFLIAGRLLMACFCKEKLQYTQRKKDLFHIEHIISYNHGVINFLILIFEKGRR